MQNTIVKEFADDPRVVALVLDQGGEHGETLDWMRTWWDNVYLRGGVLWDADGAVGRLYAQPATGLPFGRGFIIDQHGVVDTPYFGHDPALVIARIRQLLGEEPRCRPSTRVARPPWPTGRCGWSCANARACDARTWPGRMHRVLGVVLVLLLTQALSASPPAIRLAFQEDAADVENLLHGGHARAKDDFLTAALGLRLDGSWRGAPAWLEADLHVVTQRRAGRRADLAVVMAGRSWESGPLRLGLGAGLLGVGNFGGQALQNGYHAATDNARLDLAYPPRRLGPLWVLELCGPLPVGPVEWRAASLDGSAGFHQLEASLLGRWTLTRRLAGEGLAGLAWRHHLHKDLRAAFHDGPRYGALADWEPRAGWHLLAWAVANANRRDQSQAGIALGWGPFRESQLDALALRP